VTANCVSLGTMKTGAFAEALRTNPELEQRLARHYPVPRVGEPEEPAALIALLCSDAAAWITGQVYPVDGGYVSRTRCRRPTNFVVHDACQ
jgi:3-oxoacyl-[acyl-carrier protein] reductase